MTRDDMNTFFYLTARSQHDDRAADQQAEVRSDDSNSGVPMIVFTGLILITLLSFLVMTV